MRGGTSALSGRGFACVKYIIVFIEMDCLALLELFRPLLLFLVLRLIYVSVAILLFALYGLAYQTLKWNPKILPFCLTPLS